MIGVLAIIVLATLSWLLLRPKVLKSDQWRAIATPLASIIGSGFLVSVPILRDLSGSWAAGLMALLLGASYLIGAAIRHNILHVEPLLQNGDSTRTIASLERLSHAVLAVAYFISVAYYLSLFSTFLLKPFDISSDVAIKLTVSLCLLSVGLLGYLRGFDAEERLEIYTVSIKLAVIGALLVALFAYMLSLYFDGGIPWIPGHFDSSELPVLLGLLIVVQGFETSRFLGNAYSPELRVKTMKQAQWLSAIIYLGFFAGMIPLMGAGTGTDGVAAIIDMLMPISWVLPVMITLGALASQSSAAVADMLGAGGLIRDISGRKVDIRHAYALIAIIATVITWQTDIYTLIALASRGFALYYAIQCIVAAMSAHRLARMPLMCGYLALAGLCGAVVFFGTPVEGG